MTDELLQRLEAHSNYFTSMLAMVPDKYMREKNEELTGGGKFYRNKRERKPKQSIKEASKRAKRLKLDPEHVEAEEHGGAETEPQEELPHVLQRFNVEGKQSESLNDLREKLRAKIETLQSSREVVHHTRKKKVMVNKKDKKKKIKTIATTTHIKKPSVVREDGKIVFSKFDFTTPSEPSDKVDKQKKIDYKKLIAKAEAKERSLKELKEKDARKSEQLEEQLNWKRVINKARGSKVKDDPGLLKKTLKRKEQQKRSSKKKWETRKSQELKRIEQKQETRQRHIKERQDAKKARKMGSKFKKGKVKKTRNPGF